MIDRTRPSRSTIWLKPLGGAISRTWGSLDGRMGLLPLLASMLGQWTRSDLPLRAPTPPRTRPGGGVARRLS